MQLMNQSRGAGKTNAVSIMTTAGDSRDKGGSRYGFGRGNACSCAHGKLELAGNRVHDSMMKYHKYLFVVCYTKGKSKQAAKLVRPSLLTKTSTNRLIGCC